MRRLNSKALMMLLVLFLSTSLSAEAGTVHDGWTVNPYDYRYDMSLYFNVGLKASESMDSFEVGAFVGDECRGVAEMLELSENGGCRYMRIRSNSSAEQHEEIVFKIRNKTNGETFELSGAGNEPFLFVPDSMMGLPSKPYMMYRLYNVRISAAENGIVDFSAGKYPENTSLKVVATPDEGYHFEKWSDGVTDSERSLVVTSDIDLVAYFAISSFKAVFMIDDEVLDTLEFEYGAPVLAPEVPAREGHSFEGWKDLPEVMPAANIVVTGSYKVNSYKAVFKIGEEIYDTSEFLYGASVTAPDAPEKEGYTFVGWKDMPATMPAKDVEIHGVYSVNTYKAVFKIGDDVVATLDVEYGASITAPEAPAREGYTFAGWGEIPATMPAKDIEINGSYTVNTYTLTVYLDDEVYMVEEIEYGAQIEIPVPDVPDNRVFDGWKEKIPETMPAYDVEIHGTTSDDMSSVGSAIISDDTLLTVYNLRGVLLYKDKIASEVMPRLVPGLYIINGKKVMVK